MTTLRDLLLELRANRLGIQALLKVHTGQDLDLLAVARVDEHIEIARRRPRDHTAILHRNDEAAAARERLAEMGDDTLMMIEKIREEFGEEAAEGMRKFHEEKVVGNRR